MSLVERQHTYGYYLFAAQQIVIINNRQTVIPAPNKTVLCEVLNLSLLEVFLFVVYYIYDMNMTLICNELSLRICLCKILTCLAKINVKQQGTRQYRTTSFSLKRAKLITP